jgi:hypothetical protein
VTVKVKTICRRNVDQTLQTLIRQFNPAAGRVCLPLPGNSHPRPMAGQGMNDYGNP